MIEVALGGGKYTIKKAPYKVTKKWRKNFYEKFGGAISLLDSMDEEFDLNMQSISSLAPIAKQIVNLAVLGIDDAVELLFEYSVELSQKREEIEETANDDELLNAFWQVVQICFPFGDLMKSASRGMAQITNSQSLPSANGAELVKN